MLETTSSKSVMLPKMIVNTCFFMDLKEFSPATVSYCPDSMWFVQDLIFFAQLCIEISCIASGVFEAHIHKS